MISQTTDYAAVDCPSWCLELHTRTHVENGFHHVGYDTATLALSPHSDQTDGSTQMFVVPSLYVPAPDDDSDWVRAPQVEIQSERGALLSLSVDDARQLAAALLKVATIAAHTDV